MKKSKKLIGIFSTIGALSIIAASCAIGIVYSKNNDVNASQSNIDNSSLSQASNPSSSSQVNTNSLSTTNAASTSNNSINNNSSSLTNSISSVNAKQLNNAPTLTLQNSMIDTSTLSNNPTLTYTCPNGNVLLFSVNNSNAQTVTLLGFSKKVSSDLVIPNILVTGGSFYAVTSISAGAFYGQGLSSVTFNNNLLSIGALAFANNNLTSLKFPHSLQSIGDKAFISNQFPHAYAVYLPINCS
ncbi:leucine-rich repeat protein [bacterium]|nr:leucine-rich repeat protein [bacterium]